LEFWGSSLKTLTITGNSDLTKITGDKVIAIGATAGPTVTIHSNDLEASVAQVLTTTTGAFTTNSNIGSLAAYFKLVQADVKSNAAVYFDTVQSTTSSVSVETGSTTTYAVTPASNVILKTTPGSGGVTTGANTAVKEQRGFYIDVNNAIATNATVGLMIDGVAVLHSGSAYGAVTLVGNLAVDLANLKSALALSRATTLGTTLDFQAAGASVMPSVVFQTSVSSATNGEAYTDAQVAAYGLTSTNNALVTTWDNFTITIDGITATASISGVASASGAAAKNLVASALGDAWAYKYNTLNRLDVAGTSPTVSLWNANGNSVSGTISIALKSTASGSRGFNKAVSVAHTVKSTADQVSNTSAGTVTKTGFIDWIIGSTEATTDNNSTATGIIMTLLEVTNSVSSTSNNTSIVSNGNVGTVALATTLLTHALDGVGVATNTALNIYPLDARGDVVNAEGANEGVTTATVARVSTDRSQWTFTAG
jgi:hypothetical protein